MQESATESSCVVCAHEITNPICPDCLAKRIRGWLAAGRPALAAEVDGFDFDGMVPCLFCGKGMSICAHCFSKDVYEQFAERHPGVAEEFLSRFDFDLRREMTG